MQLCSCPQSVILFTIPVSMLSEGHVRHMVQDPVPHMAKFCFLYARPGNKVLQHKDGDMIVCPTPLDVRLQSYRRGKVVK